jgi:peptide/nickel transport system permease protein
VKRMILSAIAQTAAVLLCVSAIVFFLGSLIPGDQAIVVVGSEGATPEQYQEVRHELGLDQPLPVQYIRWLEGAVQGDFGTSPISGVKVSENLAQQIPVSFELAALGLALSTLIGVPAGILAATHANGRVDALLRSTLLIVFSTPVFVVGAVFLLLAARLAPGLIQFYEPWSVDPIGHVRAMVMPVATITITLAAMTMQLTRGAMLEVLSSPFIVTARAAGIQERRIEYQQALKNVLPSLLTFLGLQFGVLLGGLFIVEQMFSLPGLGRGMLDAISQRDYQSVTAIAMVFAFAFVVINLIVDVMCSLVDPRQRSE